MIVGMSKSRRCAILRLALPAITFVVFVAGVIVLITTRSAVLVSIGFALLLVTSAIGLPGDIRIIRQRLRTGGGKGVEQSSPRTHG